jgi:predicted nucleic acid-binding protein
VPATWALEVASVIARAEAKGVLSEAQSGAFLEMLDAMDIGADAETAAAAFSGTLRIARRYRLSSYHASYLELAIRKGVPLATLDEDLRKAAAKAGVKRLAVG